MKKGLLTMAGVLLTVSLVSAGTTVPVLAAVSYTHLKPDSRSDRRPYDVQESYG